MRVDLPPGLPKVVADPPVMERVIANLTANALRYSPAGAPPLVTARARSGRIELRVIDCGPGVPEADRDRMFAPFQRLGDTDSTTGVGLGLAVSRGLTEAMRGTLQPAQTPGGGLTMTMSLPAAPRPTRAHPPGCRPPGDWIVRHVTGSSRDRDHPWNFRIGHFGKVTQSARSADSTLDPDEQFPINIKAGGARRGAAGAIAICSDYLRRARHHIRVRYLTVSGWWPR